MTASRKLGRNSKADSLSRELEVDSKGIGKKLESFTFKDEESRLRRGAGLGYSVESE